MTLNKYEFDLVKTLKCYEENKSASVVCSVITTVITFYFYKRGTNEKILTSVIDPD
jgi:hypothetical protein